MRICALFVATALSGLGASCLPAAAQLFGDGPTWGWGLFHQYGGDVNRPGASPDRPYWHGDDAVPLYLRYHDPNETIVSDEYGMPLPPPPPPPETVVAVAAAVAVERPLPRHVVHRRHAKVRVAKMICSCKVRAK